MEIKLRANIVMSKELTIEANDWVEAVEKARTMMAEPIPYKELTPTKVYHEMETLLTGATQTLALCHQMIENEAMIREDAELLKSIYQNSCQQLMGSVREYADMMEAPSLLSPIQAP